MSVGYYGPWVWVLWVLLATIAVAGGLVVYRAFVAYRAHPSAPLLYLGAGLFMLAVGMPTLWLSAYMVTDNIFWCSLAALAGILVGFLLLLLSLQTRRA